MVKNFLESGLLQLVKPGQEERKREQRLFSNAHVLRCDTILHYMIIHDIILHRICLYCNISFNPESS